MRPGAHWSGAAPASRTRPRSRARRPPSRGRPAARVPAALLDILQLGLGIGVGRIDQSAEIAGGRDELRQQPQPLGLERGGEEADAGDVAARPIEARHQAEPQRVAAVGKHHRDGGARRLGGERGLHAAGSDENRHVAADQLRDQSRQTIISALAEAVLDDDVATLDETGLSQPPAEAFQCRIVCRRSAEKSDQRHRRLLRARG